MAGGLVNLGMIGGFLHQKTPEIVSEYLPVAKMLDGGSKLGSLMKMVMQPGGLQNVMSNPIGALSGQLQGTISQGLSSLSGLPGVGSLVSSLSGPGGLQAAAGNLLGSSNGLLSGQGILGVVSHTNLSGLVGSVLPGSASIDRVMGPLFSDGALSYANQAVGSVVSGVLNGSSVGEAVAVVNQLSSGLQGIVDASSGALSFLSGPPASGNFGLSADISALHTLATIVSSGTTGSVPQVVVDAYSRALGPDAILLMQASVAEH